MKPTMKFDKGESTVAYVRRKTSEYIEDKNRVVPIKEVYEYYTLRQNPTISRLTEETFTKMVQELMLEHAQKFF